MRIKKILLKNYRQFKDVEISFNKNAPRDLHVTIGRNGAGKTNILNAINWCLYGNEPHLSKDSQQLPRLNLKTMVDAEEGEKQKVAVEIWAEANGDLMRFRREEGYLIYKKEQQPKSSGTNFEVMVSAKKGNIKMLNEEDASSYVERFVPEGIKEFFFFDGERLDNYFRSATGQQISHATFQISQVSILENIEDRLQKVVSDLRRDAGKQDPEIEKTREELERKEEDSREIDGQINECDRQIRIAKQEAYERRRNLSSIPNVEELQGERDKLKGQRKDKEDACREKEKERQNLLFEYGKIMMLYSSIEKSVQVIREKRERKEIPPTIDKALLENILIAKRCICGRGIDPGSGEEKQISELLEGIKLSSDIAQALLAMESPLNSFKEKIGQFKANIRKIIGEIEGYKNDLEDIDTKIRKIDTQIGGYDIDKIKQWYKELKSYEEAYDTNRERIGVLKQRKEELKKGVDGLKEKLNNELKKEERLKKLKKSIDFGTKASDIITEAKTTIMGKIRRQIENETRKLFFELIWKRETFKDVTIDEEYNIHLIHSLGYECLGTISAAERELLAFAFILALHRVSGFDSPILIDTPVARVSDEQRENFGKVFSEINPDKQIILLFTPAEYSIEVSKFLDKSASSRHNLKLSPDEKEVTMEVL